MIPASSFPDVRKLWVLFEQAGKKHGVPASLLLAVAWIESQLKPDAVSRAGARGLMQMMPATAQEVARKLGVAAWDLFDPATAIAFGACYLAHLIERFEMPRVGIAAYYAGPGTVARAGGKVPDNRDVERYVRNVMAVWDWINKHTTELLEEPAPPPKPRGWLLSAPPDDWRNATPIATSSLPLLEDVARRLGLVLTRDDDARKLYLGLPRKARVAPPNGRLIVPVLGATSHDNMSYASDTGSDIGADFGTPVLAAADSVVLYSEPGHAVQNGPNDSNNSILLLLDQPVIHRGISYSMLWHAHLSRLVHHVPDGTRNGPHVEQGEIIGFTGRANGVGHLHFGVVADRAQTRFIPPFQLAALLGLMGGGSR